MGAKFLEDKNYDHVTIGDVKFYRLGENKYYIRKWVNPGRWQRYYYRFVSCKFCGEKIMRHISDIKKRGEGGFCCKRVECVGKKMRGPKHPLFKEKTFKIRENGKTSIMAYAPNHPNRVNNRVAEHRLVMEKAIGRYLTREEVVHHIDCDPHNNNIENLCLFENSSKHHLSHGTLNLCVKALLSSGALIFDKGTFTYRVPTLHLSVA